MKLLVTLEKPYRWVKLNNKGLVVDRGRFNIDVDLAVMIPKDVTSIIGVAPAEAVTIHSVDIPTKRRASMELAVPYALEEELSEEIEHLHFAIQSWVPGDSAKVAVINKSLVEGWIEEFESAQLKVDAIVPEQSLLPRHADADVTIARTADDRLLIRQNNDNALAVDNTAFDYWWSSLKDKQSRIVVNDKAMARALIDAGGENVSFWDIGEHFDAWLESRDNSHLMQASLLQGALEPEHLKPTSLGLMLASAIAALAFLVLAAADWWELKRLETAVAANQQELQQLFEQTFPDQEYLDAPRQQVASLLSLNAEGDHNYVFQYMLDIAAKTMPKYDADFDEVNYKNEGLQVGVTVPNFSVLDEITNEIEQEPGVSAILISSGANDDKVTGQIKIVRER